MNRPSTSMVSPGHPRWVPVLVLLVFAAAFPEVLSLSTPVPELLSPRGAVGFVTLLGMYGCGALLVWEAAARWGKGWLSVLPLGAAYGIAEEGFATKTFVDPGAQFRITQIPGGYGRALGIEWATFIPIDIFHAAVSIGLQLLVVALLFPEYKGKPLLGSRGTPVVAACFTVDIGLQFLKSDPDGIMAFLPALLFIAALGLGLILLAWKIPMDGFTSVMRTPRPSAPPRQFFLVAFCWLFSLLFVYIIGSHSVAYWEVLGAFYILSSGLVLYFLLTRAGWKENRLHQTAFAMGMGAAFLLWDAVFGTLIGDGLSVPFAIVFLLLLVYVWRREGINLATRLSLGPSDHLE